jgi:hypothetical protein
VQLPDERVVWVYTLKYGDDSTAALGKGQGIYARIIPRPGTPAPHTAKSNFLSAYQPEAIVSRPLGVAGYLDLSGQKGGGLNAPQFDVADGHCVGALARFASHDQMD